MPRFRAPKVALFAACLAPVGWLAWRAAHGDLTANPIEYITHFTGDWTLRFLVITLAVTPVRKVFNAPSLIRYRRMLGLFAFFYASLHFLTYLCVDKFFDFPAIAKDIVKRPYIIAGFTAFCCLIPLAVTSTAGWIRRLGGKRWQLLHRLVYVAAWAAVVHYWWLVKSDVRQPALYAALVAGLLLFRLGFFAYKRLRGAPRYGRATSTAAERGLS